MAKKKKVRDKVPYQKAAFFDEKSIRLTSSGRLGKEGFLNEKGERIPREDALRQLSDLREYCERMAETFSHMVHLAWAMMLRGEDAAQIKSSLMKTYPVKDRAANAAIRQAHTKMESLRALKETEIMALESKIRSYKGWIEEQEQKHLEWHESVNWNRPKKGDCQKNKDWKRKIYHMKNRLHTMKQKLENRKKDLEKGRLSCCFGSKKLFKAQYHLEEAGFKNHEEWLDAWRESRKRSFFLVGSSDETQGNQLCQLTVRSEPDWYDLRLLSGFKEDKSEYRITVRIPYLKENLTGNLENRSVSYHIVLKDRGLYIQPAVEVERKDAYEPKGMLGIDINDGFFSVTESDGLGQFVSTQDLPFTVKGSSEVNATIMSQTLSAIFRRAKEREYGVAIEAVNLTGKKTKIQKNRAKGYNRMISNFPYRRYMDSCESLSVRREVPLYYVSPYWTSVLGEEKYSKGLDISRHQAAAYVIARRAQNRWEYYVPPKEG